jgi:RNA polymerase sigma factor (sigma-70 family)
VDTNEFKTMYDQYAHKLYNFIIWTTGNKSSCDDILQNVFVNVWKSKTIPASADEHAPWLFAIARNACIDYYRSTKRFAHTGAALDEMGANDQEFENDGELAWREVNALPETERSIMYLHLRNGNTFGEIAAMLDLNESQVRVKAFRALKKLRSTLGKKGL